MEQAQLPYYSLNRWLQEQFGEKVYKLALDGGMSCPNRDGTLGEGGCIFCSRGGSGDFAQPPGSSVREQILSAVERIRAKTDARRFVAYFQSYTNTYAPVERLRELFTQAIAQPQVAALSVATRPDCLPGPVLELLGQLNAIKPVWVELGLQTVHEDTARFIRRGYALPVYERAVEQLRLRGITVISHVILGLPGESPERMLQTVDYLARRNDTQGIKLQLLHVLEHTELARLWRQGQVPVLSLEDYTGILLQALRRLPPEMVIHRLTGDGAKRELLAPLWSGDKKRVLNYIHRRMQLEGIRQGDLYEKTDL